MYGFFIGHGSGVVIGEASTIGGDTMISHDSVIGGNVWLINSVPPGSKVHNQTPKPLIRPGYPVPDDYTIWTGRAERHDA